MTDVTERNRKELCSVCHKPFAAAYLTTHLRRQHGIYGGRSGRTRRTPPLSQVSGKTNSLNGLVPTTVELTAQAAPKQPKQSFTVVPFLVLEDQDGGLWLAERLK